MPKFSVSDQYTERYKTCKVPTYDAIVDTNGQLELVRFFNRIIQYCEKHNAILLFRQRGCCASFCIQAIEGCVRSKVLLWDNLAKGDSLGAQIATCILEH